MNIRRTSFLFVLLVAALMMPTPSEAVEKEHVRGKILLDVEQHGEAWYIQPDTDKRRFLGRPDDAFDVMRYKGLGVTDADLARLPKDTQDVPDEQEQAMRERLSGQILLQVEQNGEAWYIYPENLKRYYLGRPEDAWSIMRNLGLGITSEELATLPLETEKTPLDGKARHDSYSLGFDQGIFHIEVVSIPNTTYSMITDTADEGDCGANCPAKTLAEFVDDNDAHIGMNGTYFCEAGSSSCVGQENRYSSPVFNTRTRGMINNSELDNHIGPMIAYDAAGLFYYFHRASEFGNNPAAFARKYGSRPVAAIANYPSLMEEDEVIVESEQMTTAMEYYNLTRVGLGFTGDRMMLVIARRATVPELAYIFEAIGTSEAINLDGGSSTALYFGKEYIFGPGRDIPNALMFKRK